MTFSDTAMMELGITQSANIHNTRSLIRTLKYVLDILQTEEAFTVEEYNHIHTHTHTHTADHYIFLIWRISKSISLVISYILKSNFFRFIVQFVNTARAVLLSYFYLVYLFMSFLIFFPFVSKFFFLTFVCESKISKSSHREMFLIITVPERRGREKNYEDAIL